MNIRDILIKSFAVVEDSWTGGSNIPTEHFIFVHNKQEIDKALSEINAYYRQSLIEALPKFEPEHENPNESEVCECDECMLARSRNSTIDEVIKAINEVCI